MATKAEFPHPWWTFYNDIGDPIKCLDEWCIIDISNVIREKDNWRAKYKDEVIVAKWKAELESQFTERTKNFEQVFAYVIRELKWYEYFEENFPDFLDNGFRVSIDDKIVINDTVISEELRNSIREEVAKFTKEEFPDGSFDYHPGSNDTVVDLVHPSLYPLKYGDTPYFVDANPEDLVRYNQYRRGQWPDKLEIDFEDNHRKRKLGIIQFDLKKIMGVKTAVSDYGLSENYQWLPALLTQENRNNYTKPEEYYLFRSYINNLHPLKYKNLYGLISNVFNKLIPGLNLCLSRLATGTFTRVEIPMSEEKIYSEEFNKKVNDFDWEDENADEIYDEVMETKKDHVLNIPPIYKKDPVVNYDFSLVKRFQKLKVIVKLANIELTPENHQYKGGSWHVEGTINEDIVATILYYYDSENITELSLSFRCAFEDPAYEQGDEFAVKHFYGLEDEDKMFKDMGSVETKQDRLLIFPNCFQHHVDAFELKDKSKPGHRKILCMFLVDPNNEVVLSTEDVPPQQELWWNDETDLSSSGLSKFSREEIKKLKSWPPSSEVSKRVREEVLTDRSTKKEEMSKFVEDTFARNFTLSDC